MPPEIAALIEKPELLIAVLGAGALAGMIVLNALFPAPRRPAGDRSRWRRWRRRDNIVQPPWLARADPPPQALRDAADQLRIVMGASFTSQPLLNRDEARVFRELDRLVIACNPDWQVMAQVSLGEVLRSKDKDAYMCINSKRVDLLLMDENCRPRHAIEYQGRGHHQGTAAARDAVKKEALRRAGIGYHEVVAGHTAPSDLRLLVEKLVDRPQGAK